MINSEPAVTDTAQAPRCLLSARFVKNASTGLSQRYSSRQLELIKAVRRHLEEKHYAMVPTYCPCGWQGEDIEIAEVERYGLPMRTVVCRGCGTLRFNPYLDNASQADFYQRYYQEMYARVADAQEYFNRQQQYGLKVLSLVGAWLQPKASVLEVGCGAGGGLAVFQKEGFGVAGCEYSEELIAFGRAQGIPSLYSGPLEAIPRGIVRPALIYLHHVFEHLDDPRGFLTRAREYLQVEGRIIIAVPDVSRIHEFNYPGGDLLPFLHIGHKHNFTRAGLERLGRRAGLQSRFPEPDPKLKTSFSHAPELWAEFFSGDGSRSENASEAVLGEEMLEYLRQTEAAYQQGKLKGRSAKNGLARRLKATLKQFAPGWKRK